MAGFTLQRRTIKLNFAEDTDLSGLEVIAKMDTPLSLFLEFQSALSDGATDDSGGVQSGFEMFADKVLLSWNLEEDGKAIPANVSGFFSLPPAVASEIISRWSSEITEPSVPLGGTSNNTAPLEQIKKEKTAQ